MNSIVDLRKEKILVAGHGDQIVHTAAGLPELPCGWMVRTYQIAGTALQLTVPASPDDLLDDHAVREANERDDYMPYWAYLWPSAIPMAAAVLRADWPLDTRVLELGCGVGLVGLAALARGWEVAMTDYEPKSVQLAAYNARLNHFSRVDAFALDWRQPTGERFPVIMGCDLLYERRNLLPLLSLIEVMLEPGGICWLADAGRGTAQQFCDLALDRGYSICIRDAEGRETAAPGFHYQLFELRREDP